MNIQNVNDSRKLAVTMKGMEGSGFGTSASAGF